MKITINFFHIFYLLKKWFDTPTPDYRDFKLWRFQTYERLEEGKINNLPLKTWWPKYTDGDIRLEFCIGAQLIQQCKWLQVKMSIENINKYLKKRHMEFDVDGLLSIPQKVLCDLIRPSRFLNQKSKRILKFCEYIKKGGGLDKVLSNDNRNLGRELQNLKTGFGNETRDCVLLYALNTPVFIADAYARKLMSIIISRTDIDYNSCQKFFQDGINRDFDQIALESITDKYNPDELNYALCNNPLHRDVGLVLLYQQFHAGIVELGISRHWDEFKEQLDRLTNELTMKKMNWH